MNLTMIDRTDSARAIAERARADAAIAEAEAARFVCAKLAGEAHAAKTRAHALEIRLAHISRHAKRAAARTRDQFALAALGDIAITADQPVARRLTVVASR